jgi:type I restriction enzyme S subunit
MTIWKEYKLSDFIEINPKVHLKSGETYSFVEMKDLNESQKFVLPVQERELKGGSRFEDRDTLFARITPCLENGKICQVKGLKDGKGYGSTEFLVFRGKDGVSDNEFVYYLSRSEDVRNFAVQNMVGTSGRQRVSWQAFENLELSLPDLPTQTAIAEILSSLDDKIELNNKINQELENLAQTLFKQWFIDFEFPFDFVQGKPNENGEPYRSSGGEMVESELGQIPKGWNVYSMSDLLETVSKTYPLKTVDEVIFLNTGDIQDGKFLHNNFSNSKTLPGQAKKSISKNDILYSEIRPANKRFAFVHFEASDYVVSTKLMVLRSKVNISSLFQYFILTQKEQIDYLQKLAESRSGTFPQITFSEVSTIKISLPSFEIVNQFVENVLRPFYEINFNSQYENQELSSLRDTLLPKLISGEIDII